MCPDLGDGNVSITLDDFDGTTTANFHKSAIQSINSQLVAYLNNLGLIGVYVEPHRDDLGNKKPYKDKRTVDNQELRLLIWTSLVKEIRTVASGKRIPEEERVNNSAHSRIMRLSPDSASR